MEPVEFEDEDIETIAAKIRLKPEFSMYSRIDRSGKFIVCRINENCHILRKHGTDFYYHAKDRADCNSGDLRISYYVTKSRNPVHFLA